MHRSKWILSCVLSMAWCASSWAVDLGTYKGCDATDAQFVTTRIYQGPYQAIGQSNTQNSVLKVAFDANANNFADVYFILKAGTVARYNAATSTIDTLGHLSVDTFGEHGLIGIALDPNFKTNRYMYFDYMVIGSGNTYVFRISRFTLGAGTTGKLDMSSEKILLTIPRHDNSDNGWHTAGDMSFDAYGDLWCAIGDNENTELSAGNTADLRGGILRIHPDSSARGFSIPKGNFGETFASYFTSQGNATVAAQYQDTTKVRAEIYVKGTRNAYTMALDPVRRWVSWGEVGPDQGKVAEEYNMVRSPVYGGWPYFAGQENMGAGSSTGGPSGGPYGIPVPLQSDPNNIMNKNTGINGVVNLPPNHNPIFAKTQACAMGGPIFVYNGSNTRKTQFPPQFNHKWLIGDCEGNYGYRLLTFDSAGDTITSAADNLKIFAGSNVPQTNTLVDMKQGPDGSLYIVDWGNSAIYRVDYNGTCQDSTLLADKTGCADPTASNYNPSIPTAYNDPRLCTYGDIAITGKVFHYNPVQLSGNMLTVSLTGGYGIQISDVSGRLVFAMSGEGNKTYQIPAFAHSGIYQLQVKGVAGTFTQRYLNLTP